MARALAAAGDPERSARRLAADLDRFLHLHRLTGLPPEKVAEAKEFLIQQAHEFIAACAHNPAAYERAPRTKP